MNRTLKIFIAIIRAAARFLAWFFMAVLAAWVLSYAGMWFWIARPPEAAIDAGLAAEKPEMRADGFTWVGQSRFGVVDGLPVLYLKGTPIDIGFANGALTGGLMHKQERALFAIINERIPSRAAQHILKTFVTFFNRGLTDCTPGEYLEEIYGLSLGCPDIHPWAGPYFHRLLNYHAAQDISYMVMDSPFLAACTAFGAWGGATAGGRLLAGRNFDWEASPVFDRDRILVFYEPSRGIPFASLSWAGMSGVVSGMNKAGLSLTINGARGRPPVRCGIPVSLLARRVLQYASDIDGAVAIVRDAPTFVSEMFLIGSRVDGRFVVLEKTPSAFAVREPEGDDIICANHFTTDLLANEQSNTDYMREGTSLAREARLRELLDSAMGRVCPETAAAALRDRRLAGGGFEGNGHRAALNAIIATHSIIMELDTGLLWASCPPHQLGKFLAFDVNNGGRFMPELTIEADPIVESGEYAAYLDAVKCREWAAQAMRDGRMERALAWAARAEELNPGFYRNSMLRADILLEMGRGGEAAGAYIEAIERRPAFASETRAILKGLDRISSVKALSP